MNTLKTLIRFNYHFIDFFLIYLIMEYNIVLQRISYLALLSAYLMSTFYSMPKRMTTTQSRALTTTLYSHSLFFCDFR